MASNEYHFVTTWRIEATPEEISAVLGDATGLPRWWPSVYLRVRETQPGDATGVGKVVDLWTKGFLPYTLRWQFTVTESAPPTGFALRADGDFVGIGIWRLRPVSGGVAGAADPSAVADPGASPLTEMTYDWTVIAEKGVLKRFSSVMKPVFGANHRWAMARGEESLRLELARRRAVDDPIVSGAIPPPPGPTFPHNIRRRR